MQHVLDVVTNLAQSMPPDKVRALATRIRCGDREITAATLGEIFGTPLAAPLLTQLISAWRLSEISAVELAGMLIAATHVWVKAREEQSLELVWTGPTTHSVSARRTEQALLEVINASRSSLFLTSFVAYKVSTIVKALNAACDRGVTVSLLLELSESDGGVLRQHDAIGTMRTLVPKARLFAWREKDEPFIGGCVHAKVAVADDDKCFITSANLTSHAMEKNMEAGIVISGGRIPHLLASHLQALVEMKIVCPT